MCIGLARNPQAPPSARDMIDRQPSPSGVRTSQSDGPIERCAVTRLEFPVGRLIGDSQVRYDRMTFAAIELETKSGQTGLGLVDTLLGQAELDRVIELEVAPSLIGRQVLPLLHRVVRPRGGNWRPEPFADAVDQALWDLAAKEAGLPLFRFLGGERDRVRAYASGLEYHLPLDEACAFFAQARDEGFTGFKCKVGHPDVRRDIERLQAFREVIGPDAEMMVDANEAWSPKEAIARLHAYRDAGLAIYWIEDPCLRDDIDGLARVSREVPFARVNSGEYVGLRGKWRLLEGGAVDVLQVNGAFSEALAIARIAAEHGVRMAVGNTPLDIGVHLAVALPEVDWIEWSKVAWHVLAAEPVRAERGYVLAPERPGHGATLSEAARSEFARPG
jgi:L-alanine-DL-glutamate epimerase-like enolase superfamily enzyme